MLARILYYYYKTLYLERSIKTAEQLAHYQEKQFKKLIKNTLSKSLFYRSYLDKPLHQWPIINKAIMMEQFDEINTVGIKKKEALTCALKAETTRDFSPMIGSIAVGLSSGTSGTRGLFLTSSKERDAWAGIMLAKLLPNGLKQKERIAFFLRANNNLYTTLNKSTKIQFHFFDLVLDFQHHIEHLNQLQPTILSAPASVLLQLARKKKQLMIKPQKIVSVAEVLEPQDQVLIEQAFECRVSQVYQCTEGFLAISDKYTNQLTMNDSLLIVEKEWLDEYRFIPIITDLFRSSQPIIRYRLDDVLIAQKNSSIYTQLQTIEGRVGDICYASQNGQLIPIFADTLRQLMVTSLIDCSDYLIYQNTLSRFTIHVLPTPSTQEKEQLITHLNQLFVSLKCTIPCWEWRPFVANDSATKSRRIQCGVKKQIE